jgi:hypothetical protein
MEGRLGTVQDRAHMDGLSKVGSWDGYTMLTRRCRVAWDVWLSNAVQAVVPQTKKVLTATNKQYAR